MTTMSYQRDGSGSGLETWGIHTDPKYITREKIKSMVPIIVALYSQILAERSRHVNEV